jgi:hypothetical protein
MAMRSATVALAFLALAGCTHANRGGCPVPGQQPMTAIELFFGRDVAGRGPVTDAEWASFRQRVIAAHFPDGFTVYDADGQGQGGRPETTVRERTKVLMVAVPRATDVAAKVAAVSQAYKAEFRQAAVGVVTTRACGAF